MDQENSNLSGQAPNYSTQTTPKLNISNILIGSSVLLLILFLWGIGLVMFVNRNSKIQLEKQITTAANIENSEGGRTSSDSSSQILIVTVIPTLIPTATIPPTPTIIPSPSPLPTPESVNDLQTPRFTIQSQYSSPTGVTNDSQGNPDTYTFEELIGINAFFVSNTIKNMSPVALENIKVQYLVNGKIQKETIITKLSAYEDRTFTDFYLPQTPGTYLVEIRINPEHTISERHYSNNNVNRKLILTAEKTPPNIMSLDVYREYTNKQTCIDFSVNDNVSNPKQMKYFEKYDTEDMHEITWDHSKESGYIRCFSGPEGESHEYTLKVTDSRGNTSERKLNFNLLAF